MILATQHTADDQVLQYRLTDLLRPSSAVRISVNGTTVTTTSAIREFCRKLRNG